MTNAKLQEVLANLPSNLEVMVEATSADNPYVLAVGPCVHGEVEDRGDGPKIYLTDSP